MTNYQNEYNKVLTKTMIIYFLARKNMIMKEAIQIKYLLSFGKNTT